MFARRTLVAACAALLALGIAAGDAVAGDAAKGKKVFNKCKACHDVGAKNKIGPGLGGFLGRAAAGAEGFKYSADFKAAGEAGVVWDDETFLSYIQKPKEYLGSRIGKKKAKTKMAFPGIRKQSQAEDLLAYLKEATN